MTEFSMPADWHATFFSALDRGTKGAIEGLSQFSQSLDDEQSLDDAPYASLAFAAIIGFFRELPEGWQVTAPDGRCLSTEYLAGLIETNMDSIGRSA